MARKGEGTIPMLLSEDKPLLMLIDGHAMVHRSWHAISVRQHLSVSKTGENITAVFGFTNTFLKAIQEWNPTHCAIVFDLPQPTFRHKQYAEYKAHRPEAPPELRAQFDRIRELMRAFNVPIFEAEGFEGDDVIGTLCRQAEEQSIETVILTGDTDTLQLVSPWVRVALSYSIQERKVYDEAAVRARYGGLTPAHQPYIKALMGDSSDNIPGVPGIGEKTAVRLITEFDSVEGVFQKIDRVMPPKLREALQSHHENVLMSQELATIVRSAPVELDLERSRFWMYDRSQVVELLRELEFFTIVRHVPESQALASTEGEREPKASTPSSEEQPHLDYVVIDSVEGLEALVQELAGSRRFAFDTETTSIDPMRADLVGFSFSTEPGRAWYVPVGHREGRQLSLEETLSRLRPILEDSSIDKVAHNANYDMTVLGNYGIRPKEKIYDSMVAAHLLGRKALGLKNLALDLLGVEMTPITDLIGRGSKQVTMDLVLIEQAAPYACADADMTGRLAKMLEEDMGVEGFLGLFSDVEMPLVPVLVTMQSNGISLDAHVLHEMSRDLDKQLKELEVDTYNAVGHAFNLNSPQQLSEVLFNELGLPKTKRTKTGYSTDAAALEMLKEAHPVINNVLEYRQLSKIKSTYVDSLPELINPRTGRIHTSYNQSGSATGRVSSSDPNLQNIPIRTELGRQVRKAFVAENAPDWTLFSADYSQIELRVLAHLSKDAALLEAFNRGEDIHSATASMMFDVPLEGVTSDHRRIAKVLNFGVIYGLSAYGISQQTEFSPEEGQKFIDSYFSKYQGIREYLEGVKRQVRETGYVETVLGRRRYVPEINASNFIVRQAAERMAVNMPIQGTAADAMKLAMIRVYRRMEKEALKARMLLQVHDELVFEVPVEEVDVLKDVVYQEMPEALKLAVPLMVDVKTGYTWGDLE